MHSRGQSSTCQSSTTLNSGFGGSSNAAGIKKKKKEFILDTSPSTMDFNSHLKTFPGLSKTLSNVCIGISKNGKGMRGLYARRSIAEGETIVEIPYENCVDLGNQYGGGGMGGGGDPTLLVPALLDRMAEDGPYLPYFKLLGTEGEILCTDYWDDETLDMLQLPFIKAETLRRREKLEAIPGSSRERKLAALTFITSRVLTVEGEEEGPFHKLLIPLLDLANHHPNSRHILTGRAIPTGTLKIVAGRDVRENEEILIKYGTEGNDRFVQDYGFLQEGGYVPVVRNLTSRKQGGSLLLAEKNEAIEALKKTTLQEDEIAIENLDSASASTKLALTMRIGMKRALSKF